MDILVVDKLQKKAVVIGAAKSQVSNIKKKEQEAQNVPKAD